MAMIIQRRHEKSPLRQSLLESNLVHRFASTVQGIIEALYPKLFDRVVAGKLSTHAASIEAGFRHNPTPFEKIIKLLPKLSAGEKTKLKRLLN
jgi:hypothetical protein